MEKQNSDIFNPFEEINRKLERVINELSSMKEKPRVSKPYPSSKDNPFERYIPKNAICNKHISRSALQRLENRNILPVYAIGGKRFYKRTDIEALFTKVKFKK